MNRLVLSAAAVVLGLVFTSIWADLAFADRRVALVIGNSAYQNAPVLANPANDAQAVAAKFKEAGYAVVISLNDLGNLPFKRAIRGFEDAATDADVVVVYYAGHGIEIRGVNYVIPVDAKLASDRDAEDEAITLDRLLQSVETAKRLGLVILDACRDNPFVRTMKRSRVAALRAITPGLSPVEPPNSNTLVAYAAKGGTGAEDGVGEHSPFTAALLNNLFVNGLDIRLAFGRIRDEVLKNTRNRQEPFVYGSIGGDSVSVVPAPAQPTLAEADPQGERADYELVDKIGTMRAWEVFLTQHPKGFYAELARQQIDKLAALEPPKPPTPPTPSSEEQRVWDRIKDSSNAAQFRDFIKRYPSSTLANTAENRLAALERAAEEREARARAEREAKAAEEARLKAEREAARKRAEEERQAEIARQKAEREAARKRAEEEQRATAAEVARQKAEREAARKRAEEEQRATAAEVARQKAEREAAAALKRAEEEQQAKAGEEARLKAEREAALKRAGEEQRAKVAEEARLRAEREAARKRAQEEQRAKVAEEARLKAEREAALKRAEEEQRAKAAAEEAACKREADRLASLQAAGRKARDDLKRFEQEVTCERLRPNVVAALEQAATEPDVKAPAQASERPKPVPNSPQLVRSAQEELVRVGCLSGDVDGVLGGATRTAIKRYRAQQGKPEADVEISDEFISELKNQSSRVCPLVCPAGQVAETEQCIVAQKPAPVAREKEEDEKAAARHKARQEEERAAARHKARQEEEREERAAARRQKARQQEERAAARHKEERAATGHKARQEEERAAARPRAKKEARPAARPEPRVRQQAAVPRYSGGGGGGHGTTIGVGF